MVREFHVNMEAFVTKLMESCQNLLEIGPEARWGLGINDNLQHFRCRGVGQKHR